jgi:hypothetical protein
VFESNARAVCQKVFFDLCGLETGLRGMGSFLIAQDK